jgi:hypothetical protein
MKGLQIIALNANKLRLMAAIFLGNEAIPEVPKKLRRSEKVILR